MGNNIDYSEVLFQSIDTILAQRLKNLPYDRTIVVTITDNSRAISDNVYRVTTDDFTQFYAYSEDISYANGDRVYVRLPAGDYSQQKIIIGKYITEQTIVFGNIDNGFFYQEKTIEATIGNPNWLFESGATSFTAQGYTGFDLHFSLKPLENNDRNLSITISLKDNLDTELYKETKSGSELLTNYMNLVGHYEVHINLPLKNKTFKIEVTATGNVDDNISAMTCTCQLGYLIASRLSIGDKYLTIYNPDDSPIYYTYQGAAVVRDINIRLLEVTNVTTLTPVNLNNNLGLLTLGLASDNLVLEYSNELEGRYQSITNEDSSIATFYNNRETDIFGTLNINNNGELVITSLPLPTTSRTVVLRAFYDDGYESKNDALASPYTFYAQTNVNIQGRNLRLEAEQDIFYIYGLSNKITPPGLAFKDYQLTLHYTNANDNNDTLEGATIEFDIPETDTMIASLVTDNLIMSEQGKEITTTFRIKDYYVPTAHNNTITVRVIKDDETYTATKELLFGSNSSQGDDYILNMWLVDDNNNLLQGLSVSNSNPITAHIQYELYNYQYELKKSAIISVPITTNSIYELHLDADGEVVTNENDDYIISGFLPIPYIDSNIKYVNAPTTIIYNITGKMPDYYKDTLQLIDNNNQILSNIQWDIEAINPDPNNNSNTNAPIVDHNTNILYARTIYSTTNIQYMLIAKQNNNILYQCPLYIGQNKYYKPMVVKEQNNTTTTTNANSQEIQDAAIGRVENDGSRLYMGINEDVLGLYASNDNGDSIFELTGTSISIGGQDVDTSNSSLPVWGGCAATSLQMREVVINNGASSYRPITKGGINTPVYFNNGVPTAITSLNETLLGFDATTNGFTSNDTKLYTWLKAIQTNMNTLASKHSDVTLTWPANL